MRVSTAAEAGSSRSAPAEELASAALTTGNFRFGERTRSRQRSAAAALAASFAAQPGQRASPGAPTSKRLGYLLGFRRLSKQHRLGAEGRLGFLVPHAGWAAAARRSGGRAVVGGQDQAAARGQRSVLRAALRLFLSRCRVPLLGRLWAALRGERRDRHVLVLVWRCWLGGHHGCVGSGRLRDLYDGEGAFGCCVTVHVELLHVVHDGCGVEGLLGEERKNPPVSGWGCQAGWDKGTGLSPLGW